MAVIDLRTGATLATLQLGSQPWRAYSTADGRHMIVPNNGEATVSVISTASLEEVARLPGAADMIGVNTGWFETVAFVLSRSEEKAVILDLERMEPAGELALPGTPETGVVTPDGTRLYVALSSTDRVAVIDVRERRLVKVIEDVGEEPWGAHMVGALNYCH
jgi:YVTN family beta-propeller protein